MVNRCDARELHICKNNVNNHNHRQTKMSNVVGYMIKDKYTDGKRSHLPRAIIADLQMEHNVSVTYLQAYRAREVVFDLIRGSPKDSYSLLP